MLRSTKFVFAILTTACMAACPVLAADKARQAESPPANAKTLPPKDEQQVQGHWLCTQVADDGEESLHPDNVHAVFTDKEVKICSTGGGTAYEYKLNPKAEPKRCELNLRAAGFTLHGIYDLQGDTVKLSLPKSNDSGYPEGFEPKKGRVVYTFRRAKKSDMAVNMAAKSKEDTEDLDVLRKGIAETIALLEAKKYREFFERIASPDRLEKLKAQEGAMEELVKSMTESKAKQFAGLLRLVAEQPMTLDSTKTHATFDLRGVHCNGTPGKPFMHFVKIGDQWYLEDK